MDDILDLGVEDSGQAPPAPDAGAGDKSKTNDEVTQLRDELAHVRNTNRELDEQARGYREELSTRAKPVVDEPIVEEEDETPEAFVDSIAALGPKAIVKILDRYRRQNGLITKVEAEAIADAKASGVAASVRSTISAEGALFTAHPGLADKNSEMYKATGVVFREMCAEDPGFKTSAGALMVAARIAKAELGSKGGSGQREAERIRRIEAQSGDRGNGRSERETDTGDASPQGLSFARALGVSEKDYMTERSNIARSR